MGEETRQQLTNVYSDRLFNHGVRKCAVLMAEHIPVYVYQFAHNRGDYSIVKWFGIDKILGAFVDADQKKKIRQFCFSNFQEFHMSMKFHSFSLNRTDWHPNFRKIQ